MKNLESLPLVSVYIPTHNRVELLRRAIRSVLSQTYPAIELLVSDDASTDNTEDFVKTVRAESRIPIRYFRSSQPRGACVARNVAIDAASGEFITGLDDDDVFHPRRLEVLLNEYDESYSCVCAGALAFRSESEFEKVCQIEGRKGFVTLSLKALLYENFIGNQVFTETSRLRKIGGFDVNAKAWQDYDTWVRLLDEFGPAKKLHSFLYYMDEGHDAHRITNSNNRVIGATQFLQKHDHRMSHWHRRSQRVTMAMLEDMRVPPMQLFRLFNLGGYRTWAKLALYSMANVKYKW